MLHTCNSTAITLLEINTDSPRKTYQHPPSALPLPKTSQYPSILNNLILQILQGSRQIFYLFDSTPIAVLKDLSLRIQVIKPMTTRMVALVIDADRPQGRIYGTALVLINGAQPVVVPQIASCGGKSDVGGWKIQRTLWHCHLESREAE